MTGSTSTSALAGLRVIDASTIVAGPLIGTLLADFGADVIKVEHPEFGDGIRRMGWSAEGVSLFSALISRNKRCVTLKLSAPEGAELLKRLVADADVFIENFRPGTLERWGLGPEVLHELNPGLVIVRTTGFGQTGPYKGRPGFGTLAESLSGFAAMNGWPETPPTLPSFALGDSIAGLTGCFATMFALWHREQHGGGGQVIDLSLIEPLFWILGPQASAYEQSGVVQGRTGNSAPWMAPRGAYLTADGKWLGLSGSSQAIAERVVRIIGHPELVEEEWFADHVGRLGHAAELDALISEWIGARTADEVLAAFADGDAAIAPIYSIADIVEDEHFKAREALVDVPHPQLGSLLMQNMIVRLSETPGEIRFPGAEKGAHNEEVFGRDLGLEQAELDDLTERGVI
ncbi:MAG: CoA transferase [Actinobacteria bacterium]|nr:CoA transferase [Actinomycetota bacterium]